MQNKCSNTSMEIMTDTPNSIPTDQQTDRLGLVISISQHFNLI